MLYVLLVICLLTSSDGIFYWRVRWMLFPEQYFHVRHLCVSMYQSGGQGQQSPQSLLLGTRWAAVHRLLQWLVHVTCCSSKHTVCARVTCCGYKHPHWCAVRTEQVACFSYGTTEEQYARGVAFPFPREPVWLWKWKKLRNWNLFRQITMEKSWEAQKAKRRKASEAQPRSWSQREDCLNLLVRRARLSPFKKNPCDYLPSDHVAWFLSFT